MTNNSLLFQIQMSEQNTQHCKTKFVVLTHYLVTTVA